MTGGDRLVRKTGAGFERLLIVDGAPVLARVRPAMGGLVRFSAEPVDPSAVTGPGAERLLVADEDRLFEAITRMRFAIAIDLDLTPLRDLFGDDELLAPAITGLTPGRPQRRPEPVSYTHLTLPTILRV